jgi:hypothetical protein
MWLGYLTWWRVDVVGYNVICFYYLRDYPKILMGRCKMEKWQYDLLASKYGHENIKFSANKSHITGEGKTLKAIRKSLKTLAYTEIK